MRQSPKRNGRCKMKKEPTKKELKEWIKNERDVFLNSFFDLLNQRKELEQKVQRLQEQLNEANELLKAYGTESLWESLSLSCDEANEYCKKWGVK